MRAVLFFFIALFSLMPASAEAREPFPVEIALTFDDFPLGTSAIFEKKERVQLYVDQLNQLNIQAAFFCVGEHLTSNGGMECLSMIAKEHVVANHSFHHLHLSKLSLADFEEEILTTEALLSGQPNFRKWFRFPFLDYGDRSHLGGTDRKRCAAFLFLKESGYQHGYITIPTLDWYVNGELKRAVKEGKSIHWENLRKTYLSLLDEWIEAYHQRWSQTLKRKFVHVLLLHQNDLNAIFLNDIVDLIRQKGWRIVSAEEAFRSPIPYLAKFANTKTRLFKGVASLSTEHIDHMIQSNQVFNTGI
jgi:peptidoglycan-N-acetylglucosamine deacetylase